MTLETQAEVAERNGGARTVDDHDRLGSLVERGSSWRCGAELVSTATLPENPLLLCGSCQPAGLPGTDRDDPDRHG